MSVVGIGTDIVSVERVAKLLGRHGERFIDRCFREPEKFSFAGQTDAGLVARVAGRWAAKEAFLKALGGDIAPIPYRDVYVVSDADGAPRLVVGGAAEHALGARGGRRVFLSISHERQYAVAVVLIED